MAARSASASRDRKCPAGRDVRPPGASVCCLWRGPSRASWPAASDRPPPARGSRAAAPLPRGSLPIPSVCASQHLLLTAQRVSAELAVNQLFHELDALEIQ